MSSEANLFWLEDVMSRFRLGMALPIVLALAVLPMPGSAQTGPVRIQSASVGVMRHDLQIPMAVFSPDGTTIATVSRDRKAALWDGATGELIREFIGHQHWIFDVQFSPDGTKIVTASQDGSARLWDVATGTQIAEMRPFGDRRVTIRRATFSPDGRYVVTAQFDRSARIWDARNG